MRHMQCALQAVVVGCSDGGLYFLDIASGRQQAVVDTAGAIKSPPVVDSWQGWGCVWTASHGKQLLACSSQGEVWSATAQKYVVHLQTFKHASCCIMRCSLEIFICKSEVFTIQILCTCCFAVPFQLCYSTVSQ